MIQQQIAEIAEIHGSAVQKQYIRRFSIPAG